jgi:hypothetical protein
VAVVRVAVVRVAVVRVAVVRVAVCLAVSTAASMVRASADARERASNLRQPAASGARRV